MKSRLDLYLTENNIFETREKARAVIMAGQVYINNQRADKAGQIVKDGDLVEFRGETLKYVSRGGLKLEKAICNWGIDLKNKVCMDIGASTGGFTDCMLLNGAVKVYAVDVGYGQLAWKLRVDERVVNLERTNIRYLKDVDDEIDFFSVDVSFISLKLVLPVIYSFLKNDGEGVCLIKPQFEAGRDKVGKKGVVRDKDVHIEVITKISDFVQKNGFSILGIDFSPIKGPEGNIEYLLYIKKQDSDFKEFDEEIKRVVELSHEI